MRLLSPKYPVCIGATIYTVPGIEVCAGLKQSESWLPSRPAVAPIVVSFYFSLSLQLENKINRNIIENFLYANVQSVCIWCPPCFRDEIFATSTVGFLFHLARVSSANKQSLSAEGERKMCPAVSFIKNFKKGVTVLLEI